MLLQAAAHLRIRLVERDRWGIEHAFHRTISDQTHLGRTLFPRGDGKQEHCKDCPGLVF